MKILIVEDTYEELQMAMKIAKEMGFECESGRSAEAMYSLAKWEGQKRVPCFDGVVTDIFIPAFPLGHPKHDPAADQPCGVGVALKAKEEGIPAVFCTSEYHHGAKGQWISSCEEIIGARYVDRGRFDDSEEEKKFKPWRVALSVLRHMIEKKSQQIT